MSDKPDPHWEENFTKKPGVIFDVTQIPQGYVYYLVAKDVFLTGLYNPFPPKNYIIFLCRSLLDLTAVRGVVECERKYMREVVTHNTVKGVRDLFVPKFEARDALVTLMDPVRTPYYFGLDPRTEAHRR